MTIEHDALSAYVSTKLQAAEWTQATKPARTTPPPLPPTPIAADIPSSVIEIRDTEIAMRAFMQKMAAELDKQSKAGNLTLAAKLALKRTAKLIRFDNCHAAVRNGAV